MKTLLLCHEFDSLTQRVFVELRAAGHEVSVEFDIHDSVTEEALAMFRPDLVIATRLERPVSEAVARKVRCLVVHPGIVGDEGPTPLDWAIQDGASHWGVTIRQALGGNDAGPVWAHAEFGMREATKSSLYRREVTDAAVIALREALERIEAGRYQPRMPDRASPLVLGRPRPAMTQADRAIDWARDDTARVLRKLRAADGEPGVRDSIFGVPCMLYDGHAEAGATGEQPGRVIARRGGALLRATLDGAVWIGHVRRADLTLAGKLPAAHAFPESAAHVPEMPAMLWRVSVADTLREVWYEEHGPVGYVHFPFYGGALGPDQCEALTHAIRYARQRPTRVIALMGGSDLWSNGSALHQVENTERRAAASTRSLDAVAAVTREVLSLDNHLTASVVRGNAGAGGVCLALAADSVAVREGAILNPGLGIPGEGAGAELWAALLRRRVSAERAFRLAEDRLPLGARDAAEMGLVDALLPAGTGTLGPAIDGFLARVADKATYQSRLTGKQLHHATALAPMMAGSEEEDTSGQMELHFFGAEPDEAQGRHNFGFRVAANRTPSHLARHRDGTTDEKRKGA